MKPQKDVLLPCFALGLAMFIMNSSESIIFVCYNSSLLKYGGDIAVGAMTILMVDFRSFLAVVAIFVILVALFRYISLGSIAGAITFPSSLAFFTDYSSSADVATLVFATVLAVMVVSLHYPNIIRLFRGEESKINFKK